MIIKYLEKLRGNNFDLIQLRERARLYWIKHVQSKHFQVELEFLHKPTEKVVPSLVRNLNLFLDDNSLLRSRGRLNKCLNANYDLINTFMLPKESFLTELLVTQFHVKCKHLGVATTINTLRNQGYWLPKGRSIIKKIISDCITCKMLNSFSIKYPKRTDFVGDRVNFVTPFRHTGVDFTGHFYVKLGETTVKMYLLIFTCLNIRAVHLELVPSMNTADFLLAFIKFINIYNVPFSIYSDNASTFLSASKILNECKIDDPLTEYLLSNSIRHVRIPVYSAWVGSACERLIRVVKSSIYKCMGRKKLEYFQFSSLLTDIQNAVNSRPVTYRDSDAHNLDIITPNSFLKFCSYKELSFGSLEGSDIVIANRSDLKSTLNKRENMFEIFKDLWYDSYLLYLRESSRDVFEDNWTNKV